MFRRLLIVPAIAGAALLAAAGCNQQPNNAVAGPKGESGQPEKPVNIGAPLFAVKQLPPATQPVAAAAPANAPLQLEPLAASLDAVRLLLHRFFKNSPELLVLNVLKHERIDPEELRRLKQLIEESEAEQS